VLHCNVGDTDRRVFSVRYTLSVTVRYQGIEINLDYI